MESEMNKYPKSKYPFMIEHIGYPVTNISGHTYKPYSYHTSKRAAYAAITRYNAHLDYGQWDDHYRVIDRCTMQIAHLTAAEFYGHWK